MKVEYYKKIYGFDCDVYGHLNNSSYLKVYEEARAEALNKLSLSIRDLLESGIHIYLTKIELNFLKAVELEDTVRIITQIEKSNRLRATWKQEIFNSKNELCNMAIVEGVFVKEGKPFRLPVALYEKIAGSNKKKGN